MMIDTNHLNNKTTAEAPIAIAQDANAVVAAPTTVGSSALEFKARGYLVAAKKHAAEWAADSRVQALTDADKALSDYPGLTAVKASKGLEGTRPIGKWSTETGSYWHWVVEELRPGLVLVVR